MSILSINLVLSAARRDGGTVSSEDFLVPLQLSNSNVGGWECVADRPAGMTGLIVFFERSVSDIDGQEPHEVFAHELTAKYNEISDWFESLAPNAISDLRNAGLDLAFSAEAWIDQDQIDIDLPPRFMASLGFNGIPFQLISNE